MLMLMLTRDFEMLLVANKDFEIKILQYCGQMERNKGQSNMIDPSIKCLMQMEMKMPNATCK